MAQYMEEKAYLCGENIHYDMAIYNKLWLIGLIFLLCACGRHAATHAESSDCDSTLTVKYATGFKIDYFSDYKRVTIINPWNKKQTQSVYYLVRTDTTSTPLGVRVRVPLHTIAVTSCTHYEPLTIIGEAQSIEGVCNPEMIYNADIRRRYEAGEIANLGDAFDISIERLLALHPDALIVASYNQQDNNTMRLKRAGIPVIYNNEWTENDVLARAEWMKLMAAFYDKEAEAAALFDSIEARYLEAKRLAQAFEKSPTVFAGGNFRGTWYMPSGHSYMGQLFADAGADYLYKDNPESGSLPLNFETVLLNFAQADVWLNAPTATLAELFAMDKRHKLFKAAQTGEVYGFYAKTRPTDANDFWESAVTHPDLILKDLIWALHHDSLPDYEPTYLIKLK